MTSRGIGPGFSDVDSAADASANFIQYLDAARKSGNIAQGERVFLCSALSFRVAGNKPGEPALPQ